MSIMNEDSIAEWKNKINEAEKDLLIKRRAHQDANEYFDMLKTSFLEALKSADLWRFCNK